ncbi:hypothetical protein FRC15_007540, partial [Serendipita sp. 397]
MVAERGAPWTSPPFPGNGTNKEFLNPELNEGLPPLTTSKIYHAIKNSVIINFGDAGWGAVGVSLNIKYYSPTTSLCILKVGREHIRIARAA